MANNFFEVRMILAVMNAIYWRNCVTKPYKNDSGHQRGSNWPREAFHFIFVVFKIRLQNIV